MVSLSKLDPLRWITGGRFVLFPRWPDTTGYRAVIATFTDTSEKVHDFVFVTDSEWDEPFILANGTSFQMPEDPTFVKKKKLSTTFNGHKIPVYEISPVPESEITGDMERVAIPDEFKGRTIPVVERSDEELNDIAAGR